MTPPWHPSRRLLLGAFVAIVVAALALIFAESGSSPKPIKADSVTADAGSTSLTVNFPWSQASWCASQFTVHVSESDTEVSVANVLDKGKASSSCAEIATAGQHASINVTLTSVLGSRKVVRLPDGTALPIRSP